MAALQAARSVVLSARELQSAELRNDGGLPHRRLTPGTPAPSKPPAAVTVMPAKPAPESCCCCKVQTDTGSVVDIVDDTACARRHALEYSSACRRASLGGGWRQSPNSKAPNWPKPTGNWAKGKGERAKLGFGGSLQATKMSMYYGVTP